MYGHNLNKCVQFSEDFSFLNLTNTDLSRFNINYNHGKKEEFSDRCKKEHWDNFRLMMTLWPKRYSVVDYSSDKNQFIKSTSMVRHQALMFSIDECSLIVLRDPIQWINHSYRTISGCLLNLLFKLVSFNCKVSKEEKSSTHHVICPKSSHSHCSLVNNKLSLLTDLFSLISIGPETGAGAGDDVDGGEEEFVSEASRFSAGSRIFRGP